jgi:extracellular factor (EF) 3-hydroxypalmitic acid methyl ester biosynthesis protein
MDFDVLLHELIAADGPMPTDYAMLNQKLRALGDSVRAGLLSRQEVLAYARDLTERNFQGTMQAQALERKYGYSGDFEMIDAIYRQQITTQARLRRWDLFFHAQAAPIAVRNRKAYFCVCSTSITACREKGRCRCSMSPAVRRGIYVSG